ncbi:SWPV1-283 [Shearwaterpox virus]|uniref:SWPV1-283 n=1 Tax=Shearwaterpox virus TaxID=1974596 RepID=A0A1V0S886_CNPV|nr:SWPV1-283 [Shearwaterpox virus]
MIRLYKSMYIDTKENILHTIDLLNYNVSNISSCYISSIPFHQAIEARNLGVVKELLLRTKANINKYDHRGLTPLHIACMRPNKDGMKELIDEDIRNTVPNVYKIISFAHENRNVDIFRNMLIDYYNKQDYSNNLIGIYRNSDRNIQDIDIEIVRLLLENGANVNKTDKVTKSTPLYHVADYKNTKIMELLILYGAKINIPNICNSYPLHKACTENNIKGVEILLDNNAYTGIISLCSNTPLHISSGCNTSYEILKMLLERGANVNIQSSILKSSPLHIAIRDEQKTKLLLEYKADVNSVNTDNDTPISVAVKRYSGYNICKLLITSFCIKDYTSKNIKSTRGFKINIDCINKNKVLKEIKKKCDSELEILKNVTISNGHTVIDFLKDYSYNLDILSLNKRISTIQFENFEIYGDILRRNIENARHRNLLITGSIDSMDNILCYANKYHYWNIIPLEIKRKIISLLDDNSLCNIIAV